MKPLRLIVHRLRALFRKENLDAEMSEEMQAHLDLLTVDYQKRGLSAAEARSAARRAFGGVEQIKERARDQRGWMWLDHLARDVRHGWRMIAKAPLISAVIVVSLGIGVGVNVTIFSWISSLVFRPLPGIANVTRFHLIEPKTEAGNYPGASWLEYRDLRERLHSFDWLLAYKMLPLNLGELGQEERVYSQLVSGNYFSVLGLRPTLGRFFREDEAVQPGGAPVIVISHSFWQSHLAGAPDVIGRRLRLNDQQLTVIGVAPEGFLGTTTGLTFDLWAPATMAPVLLNGSRELETREARGYSLLGTLRAGVTTAQARGELVGAMREFAANYPSSNVGFSAELLPFWRAPRGAARLLLGALAALQSFLLLVLLVVCVNAANLLLARATVRRRELGVRLALGARPWQLLRLVLIESALLGAMASALGTLLAVWGTTALRVVSLPGGFPFKFQTDLDVVGLAFAAALGVGSAIVFGLAPALHAARTDSQLVLRTSVTAAARRGARSPLVAVEVALALFVLVVAAMFLRSFLETRTADTGFKPEGVLLAAYDLSNSGYDKATGIAMMDELLRRLRATPGIEAAAVASWVPLDFHSMPLGAFKLDGRARSDGGQDRAITYNVTPGYLDLMRIPLVAGRDFDALADKAHGPQAIVNEEFAKKFFEGRSPLGHRIEGFNASFEIVGVARNALYETFGEAPKPIMYFSLRDRFALIEQIHIRTNGAESALAPNLRRIVREINPVFALFDVRTLTEHVDKNLFFRKIPARIFAGLGPLILLLAAIGIYAMVAYSVAQRTMEIGVRLALGASTRRVVLQIVRESMRIVWFGLLPAWLVSVVAVLIRAKTDVLNAVILVGTPAILVCVAWLAAWLPARRAAKVDPMVALRAE